MIAVEFYGAGAGDAPSTGPEGRRRLMRWAMMSQRWSSVRTLSKLTIGVPFSPVARILNMSAGVSPQRKCGWRKSDGAAGMPQMSFKAMAAGPLPSAFSP
ncbi:MAG TPA: hypothetical protein DDZ88_17875 [Verrucomicrobiales bacterium]|nr:hypothetical protein [Verrucomicrobiales bacterium]